jgi:putative FmdB family regulatory protein
MPIYEYVCADCSHKFETLVRAWGDAVSCPQCRSQAVQKLLSTFAMAGGGRAEQPTPGACCGGGCGCRH